MATGSPFGPLRNGMDGDPEIRIRIRENRILSGIFFSLFSLLWTPWDLRVTPRMDRNHIISIMYPWGRSEHRRAEGPWVRVQFKIDFNHGGVLMTVAAFVVAHLMTILLDSKVWKKIGKSVCKRCHAATSMYRWHEF